MPVTASEVARSKAREAVAALGEPRRLLASSWRIISRESA